MLQQVSMLVLVDVKQTFCANPIVCASQPSIFLCVFIYGQTLKNKAKHPKMGTDGVCLLSQIIL